MKLTFTYRLVGRGWSEATLSDGEQSLTVFASYLSDALRGLIEAVIILLQGADRASCRFADEPGEYRWLFERRDDNLAITVKQYEKTFSPQADDAGTLLFSVEGSLRRFAVQLSNQLQALIEQHGADGYEALWGYSFPQTEQQRLARLIRESKPERRAHTGRS